MQIGILGRRMIAPDDDLLDLRQGRAALFGELRQSAVVIQSSHGRESVARQRGRIALSDQRIGVGRIADHQHAHVAAGDRVQRLALGGEDLGVLQQQILALHAGPARPRADQHGEIAILEARRWRRESPSPCSASGKAQSFNSITTPCTAALAAGISSRFKLIGWSAPSIWPDATRNASA